MKPGLRLLKGHGTENDFLVLPDLDAVLSLSPSLVRSLCDRHAGIGADGVLRVVRTEHATEPDVREQASVAEYFMDYHNADGSIAEMCGNGVRVFGRYLWEAGLITGPTTVATRGGPKPLTFDGSWLGVTMGVAVQRRERPTVRIERTGRSYPAVSYDLPNPHVVVELGSAAELDALDLSAPPTVSPSLPEGQNVEFYVRESEDHLRMRVHERGVGETRSCGTGICAVVAAAVDAEPGGPAMRTGRAAGARDPAERRWQVDVPGGRCEVWSEAGGQLVLSGPAVLVGQVEVSEDWLARHR